MINYIIIAFVVAITFYILYLINVSFENKKLKEEIKKPLKINITSDCIVVLSREDCPYCTLLEEQIVNYAKKHTVIKLDNVGNFKFDDTFTNLNAAQRNNIIEEVKKIINGGTVYFPTIIFNNEIQTGLPSLEKLNEIFN